LLVLLASSLYHPYIIQHGIVVLDQWHLLRLFEQICHLFAVILVRVHEVPLSCQREEIILTSLIPNSRYCYACSDFFPGSDVANQ
jgi:hypothetical protein